MTLMTLKELWATHTMKALTFSVVTDMIASAMFLWQPSVTSWAVVYVVFRSFLSGLTMLLRAIK